MCHTLYRLTACMAGTEESVGGSEAKEGEGERGGVLELVKAGSVQPSGQGSGKPNDLPESILYPRAG